MNKSLIKSLIPVDLAEEYAQIGADKLIEAAKPYLPFLDELGSKIPYIKTLAAAIKLPRTLSDFILGKKVYAFLYSSNLDKAKVDKLKKKFSKTKQERLWERVVFSLNTHDDKLKSEIIGKLFSAIIEGDIAEEEFFTMVHATNSLNVHVLDELKHLYMLSFDANLSANLYYNFATLGLIDIDNSKIGTIGGSGPQYPLNQMGWKYIGIIYGYPNSSIGHVRIGKDDLVEELNEEGQPNGRAFPLAHIKTKGSRYREVDMFVVRQDGQVLCHEQSGLPYIATSKLPIAGEHPNKTASHATDQFKASPIGVLVRNMEDAPIQKWAFIVRGDKTLKHTIFRPTSDINFTIGTVRDKDDQLRYYVKVIEQTERHTHGELKHLWMSNDNEN